MADQLDLTIDLPDERATTELAEDVAAILAQGEIVALSGGLGAGKTTFARALIRAFVDDPALEVPSPTFTLVQSYSVGRFPVAHFDFYRLTAPEELDEIGLDEALAEGAVLVEWPERAASRIQASSLAIDFEISGTGRRARIKGGKTWTERLSRSRAVRTFVDRNGWPGAARRYLQGDASTRTYERVSRDGQTAVLMDWPTKAATVSDRRAAYRARDVRAFVAVDAALRSAGLSAPEIYAVDVEAGLLLLEDFGTEGVTRDGGPDPERYDVAIEVVAAIHSARRPRTLPLPDGSTHRLLALDAEVLSADIEFFGDWYVPHVTGKPLGEEAGKQLSGIWVGLFSRLSGAHQSWVLFDMQSPNLFWLPERQGIARIGLIDFQDMFVGPSAYDVASLCQDARVTVPPALEDALRARYVALRRANNPNFDVDTFAVSYAILAASRAIKNLGVFARLADHLGKPHYLAHLPRTREYLARCLAHPVLSELGVWYERHLPQTASLQGEAQ